MTSVLGGGSNATQSTAIGSLQFSTSQQGGVIPLVYGTTRVACNLLDYQDFTATPASSSGGKGKGGITGKGGSGQFTYTASIVMGICQGPAVAFGLVWYNKSISPLPDMPGLSFMALGADGQDADPFWIANHGPDAIGYSGTCWFSADNYMLGASPTLPNFSVEVLGAEVGSAANQADANPASITIDFLTNPRYGAGFPAGHLDSLDGFHAYCDAAGIFLAPMIDQQSEAQQFLADLVKLTNSAIVWTGSTLKIVPYGDQPLATSYVLVRVSGDTVELDTLTLTFAAAGLPGSPVTVSYQAQPADVNTDTTDFSSVCGGLARAVSYNSTLGAFGVTAGIGLSAVVIMLRGQAYATPVTVTPGTDGDDVFTVVIGGSFTWEPVTDVVYQLGEDDFIVQASSAGSAGGPSPGGAALRQGAGPITGGFSGDPVRVERSSPADAMNYVQLECLDRANAYNTAVVETFDQGSVDRYGVRKDTSLKAHAIVDQIGVGPIVAQLVLQRGLAYRNTYSFSLGWKYCLLEPMDLVQISDARLGIAGLTVRITSVTEDEEGTLAFTAEDFFGTPGTVLYPPAPAAPAFFPPPLSLPAPAPGVSSLGQGAATAVIYRSQGRGAGAHASNYANAAPAVNKPFIFEATPQLLQAQGIAGPQLIAGLCGGPPLASGFGNFSSIWGGCDVLVSLDNASFGQQGRFIGRSTMGVTVANVDFGPADDSVQVNLSESGGTLASVSAAAAAQGVSLCAIRNSGGQLELFSFTTATLTSPNHYTLSGLYRGLYGTYATDHPARANFLYLGAGSYYTQAMPPQYIGVPLWLKFPSFNLIGGGAQTQDQAVAYEHTPTGGQVSPSFPIGVARRISMQTEVRSSTVRVDRAAPVEGR